MTEFASTDATGRYLDELGRKENELHEATRASFLRSHFFHDETDIRAMIELHDKFMREKKGKNFGERFAMAISDEYLGRVHVVELSSTDHDEIPPGGSYKDPYHDLYDWLLRNGVVEAELDAQQSGRMFAVNPSSVPVPYGAQERVIVTRVRPLLRADMENEVGTPLNFGITKLSVFAMMRLQLTALYTRYGVTPGEEWTEPMMQHVEELLRHSETTPMHRVIHKIRTGYYLESHPVKRS